MGRSCHLLLPLRFNLAGQVGLRPCPTGGPGLWAVYSLVRGSPRQPSASSSHGGMTLVTWVIHGGDGASQQAWTKKRSQHHPGPAHWLLCCISGRVLGPGPKSHHNPISSSPHLPATSSTFYKHTPDTCTQS